MSWLLGLEAPPEWPWGREETKGKPYRCPGNARPFLHGCQTLLVLEARVGVAPLTVSPKSRVYNDYGTWWHHGVVGEEVLL